MYFEKQGLILSPLSDHSFCSSRIFVPTPYRLDINTIRIYCGFGDSNNISRIGFVDVNAYNPIEITKVSENILLDIGSPGTFDDNGVCPSSIVKVDDKIFLYYFGFQLGVKVPCFLFTGLAISNDNGKTFEKISQTPILDRTDKEFLLRSAPSVSYDSYDFKMYYPCAQSIIEVDGKQVHSYDVRFLSSKDGINWGKEGKIVLESKTEDVYGFGRPFQFTYKEKNYLFYSIRSKSMGYRLGYGELVHDTKLKIIDDLNLNVSDNGWDSQMVCYSSLISIDDDVYLFYNGNGLGKTGFGFAKMVI